MSVHILHSREQDQACLFCSTSDFAFGPVFSRGHGKDADERAEAFLRWFDQYYESPAAWMLGRKDIRNLTEPQISTAYSAWLAQEEKQYADEKAAERAEEEA